MPHCCTTGRAARSLGWPLSRGVAETLRDPFWVSRVHRPDVNLSVDPMTIEPFVEILAQVENAAAEFHEWWADTHTPPLGHRSGCGDHEQFRVTRPVVSVIFESIHMSGTSRLGVASRQTSVPAACNLLEVVDVALPISEGRSKRVGPSLRSDAPGMFPYP